MKGLLEATVSHLGFRHDHYSRGAHIEALHDTFAFWRARGRHVDTQGCEPTDHGGAFPSLRWVSRYANRFIDNDEVFVVCNDIEVLHEFSFHLARIWGIWHSHCHDIPARYLGRFHSRNCIDGHQTALKPSGCLCPRNIRTLGYGSIGPGMLINFTGKN